MAGAIDIEGVRFTSPDRVVFSSPEITKRELADYYRAVADWMLPVIENRPLTLLRCPRGQGEDCFVQRRAADGVPDTVGRVDVPDEDEADGTATHLTVDSLPGLIALVQIGVLEFHVWGSRNDRLDRPDRMVIDLDPDDALPFERVVEAALLVRSLLTDAGLSSLVTTTGGKGLHVVAPLRRTANWDEVKEAARNLAGRMAQHEPRRYLAHASRADRRGRVYVDYLRNGQGATAIGAYSTRARPGAPVATPLAWEELEAGATPGDFNVRTVPKRLESLRTDPWAGLRSSSQSLSRSVRSRLEQA